jgi:hypothetical protein
MMRTFQPSVFKWDICKLIDKEHGTRQTRINGAQYDGRPQNLLVQRALVCEQGKKMENSVRLRARTKNLLLLETCQYV